MCTLVDSATTDSNGGDAEVHWYIRVRGTGAKFWYSKIKSFDRFGGSIYDSGAHRSLTRRTHSDLIDFYAQLSFIFPSCIFFIETCLHRRPEPFVEVVE